MVGTLRFAHPTNLLYAALLPSYAHFRPSISSFTMPSIACMARCAPAVAELPIYFINAAGTICRAIDGIALNLLDPGIRQQRNIEVCSLLGLAVEPQAGRNLGHEQLLMS